MSIFVKEKGIFSKSPVLFCSSEYALLFIWKLPLRLSKVNVPCEHIIQIA